MTHKGRVPRILLFGQGGQVATELEPLLAVLGHLRVMGIQDADFTQPRTLGPIVADWRPDIIVNAAAYTAVDQAEKEADLATLVNASAVGALAQAAKACGALVVHYSTDYVFDGTASTPYRESDTCHPQSTYGRTKRQGEILLQESGAPHMLFRTAWVYSAVGKNFLKTILRLAKERDELRIVADQIGCPTHAATIAASTALALHRWLLTDPLERAALQGTFHLVSRGACSWFDFASAIVEAARQEAKGASIRCTKVTPLTTAEYPTPAKRPQYSVLDTTLFEERFGLALPPWQGLIKDTVGRLCGSPA